MTKQIHVINGDSSKHNVSVVVEEQQEDFTWVPVREFYMDNPGALVSEYIWGKRRLVVMERE